MAQNQGFCDRKSCRIRPPARGRTPTSAATARARDRTRSSCEVSAITSTLVDEDVYRPAEFVQKEAPMPETASMHSVTLPRHRHKWNGRARDVPSDAPDRGSGCPRTKSEFFKSFEKAFDP